ncbi:tyrosine recombinase XerC [Tengunoibacter tsumagoiensis]|uniref:Tyrosine recombinase XerC n=2 Tax=Tengunoibacter tsumagoiensis TaxID=2014871 RepID=A0A402A7H0_9CHLR|nr:tyrosine recombinase XerC [Tengunoibacter tsumagoiensis]
MTGGLILHTNRTDLITSTIQLWIRTKAEASQSLRTKEAYEQAILSFRTMTIAAGIDLDGFPPDMLTQPITFDDREHALAALGLMAQAWASSAQKEKQLQRGVKATTYNNRLTIISSFYRFAKDRRLLIMDNPIEQITRRKIQEYVSARPLSKEQISAALTRIDKQTITGIRDCALILLLLGTGRRGSEVRQLTWQDLQFRDGEITICFRCKGGKYLYDTLEPRVVRALLTYLKVMFSFNPEEQSTVTIDPAQPLWLSLSHKRYRQAISQRGLADIFKRYFGMTTIHATRHTFALMMLKSGATIVDIRDRLGHTNIATTSRYLHSLTSDENTFASTILDEMGIEDS